MVFGDPPPWYSWIVLVVLNCLSGIFSGLNLGLMSLTEDDLTIVIESSEDPKEIEYAKRIMPVRKRGNFLLCTLLIGNTLVNVMLSVLTDTIWIYLFGVGVIGDVFALVLPTVLIVIFGEIVPQSACSRYALFVGSKSLPIVYVFMVLCSPVAYPIALILDRLLGAEPSGAYTRHHLISLINMNAANPESDITKEDLKIVGGALGYKDHGVEGIMTPTNCIFSLQDNEVLNAATILSILKAGHTRIPIHSGTPENIIAVLFCKDLLGIGFERELSVKAVIDAFDASNRVRRVPKGTKLNIALDICKRERRHMLVVVENPSSPVDSTSEEDPTLKDAPAVGICTVEDIIEDIIQEEIVDEDDVYVDAAQAKVGYATKKMNSRVYDTTALLRTKIDDAQ